MAAGCSALVGKAMREGWGAQPVSLGAPKGMLLPSWAILPAAYHEGTLRRPALLRSCAAHHQVECMSMRSAIELSRRGTCSHCPDSYGGTQGESHTAVLDFIAFA